MKAGSDKKRRRRSFWRRSSNGSLLSRYLLIILGAFLFIPVMIPLGAFIPVLFHWASGGIDSDSLKYGSAAKVQADWHAEARALSGENDELVQKRMAELSAVYTEATLFWVDGQGNTKLELPAREGMEGGSGLPAKWTADEAIRFMKSSVNGDPFTVVAFIGENNEGPGFIVLQLPRAAVQGDSGGKVNTPFIILFVFAMFAFFAALSLFFFMRIRKRLLLLQSALTERDSGGIPTPVTVLRRDEIGGLEEAFNGMVEQLREGRRRQNEEEELRKRLISNLSHDLRTPLTVMQGHMYRLHKEELSLAGQEALKLMGLKTEGLGTLIDNLLSYTLMTSGRYRLAPERQDVVRLLRESAAAWYPAWEQEGMEADIRLEGESLIWSVDKEAFRRVLDNLFQNIMRHAASGRYVGIYVERGPDGATSLVIADRGPGMFLDPSSEEAASSFSNGNGAGIGLAIVDYLVGEMGLSWRNESSAEGTRIWIGVQNERLNEHV
ncbi:ATP-binding protein [Paenibacillus sp. GCM10027627]|uniref:sensor histidine kinase n=1 Tax=unclassified Paenibacillus TaxID=185978 RepID=UPI0036343CCE